MPALGVAIIQGSGWYINKKNSPMDAPDMEWNKKLLKGSIL